MNALAEYTEQDGRDEVVAVPGTWQPLTDTSVPGVDVEPLADPSTELMPLAATDPDDMTLEELASEIRQAHVHVSRASAMVLTYAIPAGRLLAKAKKRVPHRTWKKWIELNCNFSARTAREYIRIAKAWDGGLLGADRQHAAAFDSLRKILTEIRKKGGVGEKVHKAAAGDWNTFPPDLIPRLVAWDKTRQRFIAISKRTDAELAGTDAGLRARFRKLIRDTITQIWNDGIDQRGEVEGDLPALVNSTLQPSD